MVSKNTKATSSDQSVLIIINAQKELLDATLEGRNNLDAEKIFIGFYVIGVLKNASK